MTASEPRATTVDHLVPLAQARLVQEVGAKAFHLGVLQSLGMPGAPGFVIPDAAFQAHLRSAGLEDKLARLAHDLPKLDATAVRAAGEELQRGVRGTPLAPALVRSLQRHVQRWLPGPVAVRSSAVGEDAGNASFAGQLSTRLDVTDADDLQAAVLEVWASPYSQHCLAYALRQRTFLRHLGVIVQRQVPARWAGVLFTRDPADRHSETMLLEYCSGLGERLVSGATNPGRIVLRREDAAVIEEEAGEEGVLPGQARAQLPRLVELARRLERHFDAPQDVEWALDDEDRLVLLQARPITVFAPNVRRPARDGASASESADAGQLQACGTADANAGQPQACGTAGADAGQPQACGTADANAGQPPPCSTPGDASQAPSCGTPDARASQQSPWSGTRDGVPERPCTTWSNANVAENFPHPLTPFLYSIVRRGYSAYFRGLGRGFGLSEARMQASEAAFDSVVGAHGGRLYYDLGAIHSLLHLAPGGAWLARFFNGFTGAQGYPADRPPAERSLATALVTLRVAVKTAWCYLTVQRRMRRFERHVDAYTELAHPRRLAQKSCEALRHDLRAFMDIRLNRWNDAALADTAAMVCYGVLKHYLAHACGPSAGDLHNDLLKGLPSLVSSEPVNRLWDLAHDIRHRPDLLALFRDEDASRLRERLDQAAPGTDLAAFRHEFEAYLETWGFRSSQELTLVAPTPSEDPVPTLRVLQMYVRETTSGPRHVSEAQARRRVEATGKLARALSPTWHAVPLVSRAGRFRLLLRATQGAIALRERARFKQALLYTRLRHVALALGRCLAERGVLAQADDVFFLPVEEVDALAGGTHIYPESVHAEVAARRRAWAAARHLEPPDSFVLPRGAVWQAAAGRSAIPGAVVPASAAGATNAESTASALTAGSAASSTTAGSAAAAPTAGSAAGTSATGSCAGAPSAAGELRGASACGGRARGKAAVILDVADAAKIEAGDILVTRQTDPGWASVFFLVKGLVIERGGMLSHGAIIAREYGIPALVGVPQATRRVRHGQRILVDGDQGRATLE